MWWSEDESFNEFIKRLVRANIYNGNSFQSDINSTEYVMDDTSTSLCFNRQGGGTPLCFEELSETTGLTISCEWLVLRVAAKGMNYLKQEFCDQQAEVLF